MEPTEGFWANSQRVTPDIHEGDLSPVISENFESFNPEDPRGIKRFQDADRARVNASFKLEGTTRYKPFTRSVVVANITHIEQRFAAGLDLIRQNELPIFSLAIEALESTEFQPIGLPQVRQSAWSGVSARC